MRDGFAAKATPTTKSPVYVIEQNYQIYIRKNLNRGSRS